MELQRNDSPSIRKKTPASKTGVNVFFLIIAVYQKHPTLYKVKTNKKIINAIIVKAVKIFFFLVFLSGVIIKFYLSKKEQISEINIKLNIQILILLFLH